MRRKGDKEGERKDKRIWKKCIKCRTWQRRLDLTADDSELVVLEKRGFGKHKESSDGLQAICFGCKNIMNNDARNRNVRARIRHHTATRCLTQLGKPLTPKNFVTNLEDYLGYRISKLVKHLSRTLKQAEGPRRKLRDALNEGYHIDHIKPLKLYKVDRGDGTVDWDMFRECWTIENLVAIPGLENLQKGSKYEPE